MDDRQFDAYVRQVRRRRHLAETGKRLLAWSLALAVVLAVALGPLVGDAICTYSLAQQPIEVPRLTGTTVEEAESALHCLDVEVVGRIETAEFPPDTIVEYSPDGVVSEPSDIKVHLARPPN